MGKSIVWRLLGVLVLWIISLIFTGSIPQATGITFVHHAVFLFIYWGHERLWLRKDPFTGKAIIKAFTYEIAIAIPILTMISLIFTGDPWRALAISINYTVLKLILYVIFEKSWNWKFRRKIIYMDMVGDLLHVGHINAIDVARRKGDVIVGIVSDSFAASYKRKPITPWIERARIIMNIRGVKGIMPQENLTTEVSRNMKTCGATHFLHGDDWNKTRQRARKRYLVGRGIKIIEIPYTKGVSTTRTIRKIRRRIYDVKKVSVRAKGKR